MMLGLIIAIPLWLFTQIFMRDLTDSPFFFSLFDLPLWVWPALLIKKQGWRRAVAELFGLSLGLMILEYLVNTAVSIQLLVAFALCLLFWSLQFLKYTVLCLKNRFFRRALALSSLSWLLIGLAFPPLPLGLGAGLFLAPWLGSLNRLNKKEGAALTFWASLPFNALMYYWIYNVVKVGPAVAILSGLFLMIAYLSTYNVLGAWLYQNLKERSKEGFFPVAWAGLEVLRTKGEMAFPWGHLGYAYGQFDLLIQITSWTGVFGMSALIIFSNQSLLKWYETRKKAWLWVLPGVPLFMAVVGGIILSGEQAPKEFAKVALIQPNISQTDKWDRKYYYGVIDKTWQMIENFTPADSLDLIVLPETSIPNFAYRVSGLLYKYRHKAEMAKTQFFLGVLDSDDQGPPPKGKRFFNTGRWIRGDGETDEVYNKVFLVPFSERLPFDGIIPLINFLDFGEGDFTPGDSIPLYQTGKIPWTPNICYESIFPFFVRDQVRKGSRLIVNITNDGWFGASTQPWQHLNLVRYRAAENGIPIARNTNTGVTALIDEYGRVLQHTEIQTEASLVGKIGLKSRTTVYSAIGDGVEGLLFVLFLILSVGFCVPRAWVQTIFKGIQTRKQT